jgi:hypothetical protein
MIYQYRLKKHKILINYSVEEYVPNLYSQIWYIMDLKDFEYYGQSSHFVESFNRTRYWVEVNYPELLL